MEYHIHRRNKIVAYFYEALFFGLLCSGIHSSFHQTWLKLFQFLMVIAFAIVLITSGIKVMLQLTLFQYKITQKIAVMFAIYLWGFLYRYYLHKKKNNILRLVKQLETLSYTRSHEMKLTSNKKTSYVMCASAVVLLLTWLGTSTYVILQNQDMITCEVPMWREVFGDWYSTVLLGSSIMGNVILCLNNLFPLLMFGIFYSAHAWHIKEILSDFIESVKESPNKFSHHLKIYNKIQALVDTSDSNLKSLVWWIVSYVSVNLYFSLFEILDGQMNRNSLMTLTSVLCMVVVLFIMLWYASNIPDMNEEVSDTIQHLPGFVETSNEKLELILKVRQGVSFSVGGIVSIGRGFFLSLMGTIFSYCLLVKTLPVKPGASNANLTNVDCIN